MSVVVDARRPLLYLIGQPGSGKSTLFRTALAGATFTEERQPFLHLDFGGGIELGGRREQFSGTDMLAMNVQPKVIQWLNQTPARAIIAEGDRLANDSFFRAVVSAGWQLRVVLLDCPDAVAAARRAARGSNQNPSWVAGRASKVRRLAVEWVMRSADRLDATRPPAELAEQLRSYRAMQSILAGD